MLQRYKVIHTFDASGEFSVNPFPSGAVMVHQVIVSPAASLTIAPFHVFIYLEDGTCIASQVIVPSTTVKKVAVFNNPFMLIQGEKKLKFVCEGVASADMSVIIVYEELKNG